MPARFKVSLPGKTARDGIMFVLASRHIVRFPDLHAFCTKRTWAGGVISHVTTKCNRNLTKMDEVSHD